MIVVDRAVAAAARCGVAFPVAGEVGEVVAGIFRTANILTFWNL